MGMDYYLKGPSLRHDGGLVISAAMARMGSKICMTDLGLLNPPRVQGHDWFTGDAPIVPLPKPWPSAEARERKLDHPGRTHASPEPSSFQAIIPNAIAVCKCLATLAQKLDPEYRIVE